MIIKTFEHPFTRSLALHSFIALLLAFFATYAPPLIESLDAVDIEIVDLPKTPKPLDPAERSTRIVQPSEGKITKEAKKDAFLSDKTRTVKVEISAKTPGESVRVSAKKASTSEISAAKQVQIADLGLKFTQMKKERSFQEDTQWADQSTGEALQGGQYINGMKEGEQSALNTKEFVFFSYFERVRRQLDQTWQPLLRGQIDKIRRNGRKLASNADYVTRTRVVLNPRGEVVKVTLIEESGTFDLDQAAIESLNRAGPYPNPPKGLIDPETGVVEMRWEFVLKTS